ncbi:NUDIX domain-containing protein [Pengzhenrongella frigida]|uniref:NUDIX domain-containing protein n=1 Tax=Pengzhenrongella frigida TaxID=1259133 RepID=A0A4Q5N1H0_9MICO|nr:NUDIX domain-containing protein [Cellulomonas sp. HLT2-17]RYV52022.1 NUDIX domain-containing protein [Cellulomonas sp. HLT2-17]
MRSEPGDPVSAPAPGPAAEAGVRGVGAFHRHPGDGWAQCLQGHRHWGLHGAAGLLLARRAHGGSIDAVVLQHRALWSDQGGTWGFPGGALAPGESAEVGALREASEEAGIPAAAVRLRGSVLLDHGGWTYTTVLAETLMPFEPAATDTESLEVAWVLLDDVARLPLLPAFAEAWPRLRELLEADGFHGRTT